MEKPRVAEQGLGRGEQDGVRAAAATRELPIPKPLGLPLMLGDVNTYT